jgi:hypothetical protein
MKKTAAEGWIAYYRVSTDQQGASGLGLDAQRSAVARFMSALKGSLLAEYTEVESGKSHKNRPQLQMAILECKKRRAKLVIAKLDRLARNVHFISGLMESAVEFCAVDMPQANRLTIHIMAAMAEHEREMISSRTKVALEAAQREIEEKGSRVSRRSGKLMTKFGNPNWQPALNKALESRGVRPTPAPLLAMIRNLREQGKTFRGLAVELNDLGLKTGSGGKWYASTVRTASLQLET